MSDLAFGPPQLAGMAQRLRGVDWYRSIGVVLAVLLLWWLAALVFRWRFQFGLRTDLGADAGGCDSVLLAYFGNEGGQRKKGCCRNSAGKRTGPIRLRIRRNAFLRNRSQPVPSGFVAS